MLRTFHVEFKRGYGETAFMYSYSFSHGDCTLQITSAHTFHSCTLLHLVIIYDFTSYIYVHVK